MELKSIVSSTFTRAHGLTEGFLPPNLPTGQGDFGSLDQRNCSNGLQRDAAGKARSTRQLGFMEFFGVKIPNRFLHLFKGRLWIGGLTGLPEFKMYTVGYWFCLTVGGTWHALTLIIIFPGLISSLQPCFPPEALAKAKLQHCQARRCRWAGCLHPSNLRHLLGEQQCHQPGHDASLGQQKVVAALLPRLWCDSYGILW